jgi:histidinol-phosphate/aromatic aminotransferase/cobyric acid decarboxylase-like protein
VSGRPADLSAAPVPGAHGGDGARLAAALGVDPSAVLDLSASMNPCAPDVTALAARRLDALRRYPDATAATIATAAALGVDPDRVLLTNGGSEAIALVAQDAFEGDVRDPEFSLYRRHLAVVDEGGGQDGGGRRWRSNPNNPTGELAAPDDEAAVWDEAFWPIATGTWTRGDAARGATIVGSLTKLFACPGLRVGYVLAPDAASADRLRWRQPLWSVNGLACALVPELLDLADLEGWAQATRSLQRELAGVLRSAGYRAEAPAAPWVLVSPAGDLRDRLARSGILVRDCGSFGLADTVRMGLPGPGGLERVSAALSCELTQPNWGG